MVEKKGLLIVDLQSGFNPPSGLVEQVRVMADRFDVVAQTRFVHQPNSLYQRHLGWYGQGGDLLVDRFDCVMEKTGYGLTEAQVGEIKSLGCDRWWLVGGEIDACLLACAFSLWDAGIAPQIMTHFCYGDREGHREAVKIIHKNFGVEAAPF